MLTDAEFTQVIASALKIEFGSTRNGAKILMKWTGVSSRTAKNWLSGSHAPSGVHLVLIARESTAVLKAIMLMAERPKMRSEERRVGTGYVSTCRSRRSPYH